MPRFFIDTSDQQRFVRDDDGYEFATPEEAGQAAISVLPEMARDALPEASSSAFLALVRDEQGRNVLQASLSLAVVWLNNPISSSPS